jgi:hypothetical protein
VPRTYTGVSFLKGLAFFVSLYKGFYMRHNMISHLGLLLALVIFSLSVQAQETYMPLDPEKYHLFERMDILAGKASQGGHSAVKPFYRPDIKILSDSALGTYKKTSKVDSFHVTYLTNDQWDLYETEEGNSKRPILKKIYRKKNALLHVQSEYFKLQVNPVLYLHAGRQTENRDENLYINTRGVEGRGSIDNKIGFYFFATDNQAMFQDFAMQRTRLAGFTDPVVPGEAFAKTFKQNKGVDFLTGRGYLTWSVSKHIRMQFGHDKHFIGDGYRSLFLSDFSAPYTFLKVNTKIWKVNYTNLFADMNAGFIAKDTLTGRGGNRYNRKIYSMHHLSMNIRPNLTIGLFESIMTGPKDGDSTDAQWQLSYFNPIIFYRYIEQYHGSNDNAFVGLDYKWNFLNHFSLYGQFLFDEFLLNEVRSRSKWWANKQAFQVGLKYINAFGVKNLDFQSEFNYVRPYTYAHLSNYTSYTHYNQALAHPLGANFWEWIGIARVQPWKKVSLTGKLFYIKTGEDSTAIGSQAINNNGSNIFKSYQDVAINRAYGNNMLQGIATDILMVSLQVSYMIKHNLFIDLYAQQRTQNSALEIRDLTSTFVSGGIRWNASWRLQEY